MSWRASLLGALLVSLAGLAVGVAIGGKKVTTVHTVTVVEKVKAPQASATTTTDAASSTPATTGTTPPPAVANPANQEQYLASYLESQGGAETLNHDATSVSLDDKPQQQELGGHTYQHAVAFDIDNSSESEGASSASYQIPTPGFTRLTSEQVGLQTTSNAGTVYRLTVYKNDDSSPKSVILYQATFHGPSTIRRMSFDTQGATDVLFVWTHTNSEPDYQDTFILADPVLKEGT